ncbi:MAG: hypothetical protein H7839_17155 [Magnetococcus sp. YQC-5]
MPAGFFGHAIALRSLKMVPDGLRNHSLDLPDAGNLDEFGQKTLARETGLGREKRTLRSTVMKQILSLSRTGEAGTKVVVAVVGRVVVAISTTQVPGVVVPGAATIHAVGAAFGSGSTANQVTLISSCSATDFSWNREFSSWV